MTTTQGSVQEQTADETDAPVDYDVLGTQDVAWGEEVEVHALRFMLIMGLIQLAAVLLTEWARDLTPLSGEPGSVAGHALISSIILALIVSPLAYLRGIRHRHELKPTGLAQRRSWDAIPVTIAVTLLVALLVIGGFEIFTRSFQGVMLDRASSATILTLIAGVLAYVIARQLMLARTAELLVNLAVFYLFATLFFATYFNDNPYWWQKSFSYLGMTESNSRLIFNVGLIFTGALVVTWHFYFMEHFTILLRRGVIEQRTFAIVRWVLVLAGILLAFVGIFRFGIGLFFNIVHDVSATGMGVLLGLLMVSLRRLVPGYQPIFHYASYTIAGLIVLAAILKILGAFNLVGLELAGFALAGLWLILFYRNTELLVARLLKTGTPVAAD